VQYFSLKLGQPARGDHGCCLFKTLVQFMARGLIAKKMAGFVDILSARECSRSALELCCEAVAERQQATLLVVIAKLLDGYCEGSGANSQSASSGGER